MATPFDFDQVSKRIHDDPPKSTVGITGVLEEVVRSDRFDVVHPLAIDMQPSRPALAMPCSSSFALF